MSEEKQTGTLADDTVEQFVSAVEKTAKFTKDHAEQTDAKVKELGEKADKRAEDLEEKIERGIGNVIDRVDQLARRTSVFGKLDIEQDDMEGLKGALPEKQKGLLRTAEQFAAEFPDNSPLHDARGWLAANEWLKLSAKMQIPKFAAQDRDLGENFRKLDDAMRAIQKAALQEGTATEGGNLVPTIVADEVMRLIKDAGDIYPLARQYPMTSNVHKIPDESSAVTVNWVAEEGALTDGSPQFTQKTLTANKLAGRSTFSLELLEDSNVALLPYLMSVFVEKMGGELDFQTMEGTTPFTGVQTASSVNDVATTTATAGEELAYVDLVNTFVAAGESNTRAMGIWVMSPAVFGKVVGLVDSNGQPIVKFASVETAPNGTILGRPIVVSNRLTAISVGTWDTGNIYFGPPSALVFGTRRGLSWDVTDQVNRATYQGDARLIGRFAYVVGVPAAWTRLTKTYLS